MSEEVHLLLQELPEQWNNTKKLAVTVKQAVAPLQVISILAENFKIGESECFDSFFWFILILKFCKFDQNS